MSGDEDGRESGLAAAAAAGDGDAFALLYESYEKRIYNYCLRILGGSGDAEDATQEAFLKVFARLPELEAEELNFGAYLFTAARNASYDMIERRKKAEPVAELPDDGSGHVHRERADADVEPERAAMLSSQQASVRAASERLPVRQREVLALREVEGMSYAEIADTMEMNSNSVAQLISRARTGLRNELRLGVAASVPPASADCERAVPMIAMKQDDELSDPAERVWLKTHLDGCSGCRFRSEEMAEAGISYRAWAPVAPGLYLFRDTLAKAAESIGADWSAVERPGQAASGAGGGPGVAATGAGSGAGASGAGRASRSGRLTLTTAAATLLVAFGVGFFAGQVADSTPDPADFPGASAVSSPGGERPADEGGGDGQGGAGARPGEGPVAQPAGPGAESPPPSPEPSTGSPAPPQDPDTGAPAPPTGGTQGGGGAQDGGPPADGGGNPPVTPPTPPTPADPPRDPKQPDPPPTTPPPTGPPVLVPVDPKVPPLNPSRPPRLPTP